MNRTKRLNRVAVLTACASLIAAPVVAEPELQGVYVSRGSNPDGSEYRGAVHILREGERFVVSWMSPRVDGRTIRLELSSIGVGIVTGETLAVSYVAGAGIGIVVYQIGRDGELTGRWTTVGDDGAVHSETLTKVPDHAAPEPADADPAEEPAEPLEQSPAPRRAPRAAAGTTVL